jgi:hypothetical protein
MSVPTLLASRRDGSPLGIHGARMLVLLGTAALTGLVAVILGDTFAGRTRPLYTIGFCGLCVTPFVVSYARRQRPDIGNPIYVVSIWYLLAFPLRAWFMEAFPSDVVHLGTYYYDDRITEALRLGFFGFASLLVGYYCGLGRALARRLPRVSSDFADQPLRGRALLVTAIGVLAWAYLLFGVRRVHGLDDAFNYNDAESLVVELGLFLSYGVSIAGIVTFRRARRIDMADLLFLFVVLAPTLYVFVAFVRRFVLITAVVALTLAYHYCRRRLSISRVAAIVAVMLAVVFPLIEVARSSLGTSGAGDSIGSSSSRVQQAAETLFGRGFDAYRHMTVDVVMNRMPGVDTFAGFVKAVPERESFMHGASYVRSPAMALVPRAFWPGKPRDEFAQNFGQVFFGSPNTQTHLVTFNAPDLYLNFGVIGVLVGSFVIGAVYRLIYTYFVGGERVSEMAVFLYTFVFLGVVAVEWSITTIVVSLLKAAPFLLVVAWFMRIATSPRAT